MDNNNLENSCSLQYITSAFAAVQFVLHLAAFLKNPGFQSGVLHLIAFQYDIAFLLIVTYIACFLKPWLKIEKSLALLISLLLPLYPFLMDEFLCFPVNIFNTEFSLLPFFLVNIAGAKSLIIILLAMITAGFFCHKKISMGKHSRLINRLAITIAITGLAANLANAGFFETIPNPYFHSIVDTFKEKLTANERVVPELKRPSGIVLKENTEIKLEKLAEPAYQHILFLVMETVNNKDFAKILSTNKSRFYKLIRNHSLVFSNYFTTNLDSYTSLIAMLNSEQVPYRAYANPDFFKPVNKKKGLVDLFKENGWKSMFICNANFQPFIPTEQSWDIILHGKDLPNNGQWKEIQHNAIESGIEDKAAISTILNFVEKHEKTMVMHEMVYGHSPKWMSLTGTGQMDYYDEYFCQLYEELEKRKLIEKTLLVILADHGSRSKAHEKDFYQVPLIIAGKTIEPGICNKMYSHLDLAAIIRSYVFQTGFPEPRQNQLVIGHTGRWTYGCIEDNGSSVFLDAKTGQVLGKGCRLAALKAHHSMQTQINSFARFHKE